jgi:ankyrin repeat protein
VNWGRDPSCRTVYGCGHRRQQASRTVHACAGRVCALPVNFFFSVRVLRLIGMMNLFGQSVQSELWMHAQAGRVRDSRALIGRSTSTGRYNALTVAACNDHVDVVKVLLPRFPVHINHVMQMAAASGSLRILAVLLSFPESKHALAAALHKATSCDRTDVVKMLVLAKASVHYAAGTMPALLSRHVCRRGSSVDVLKALLQPAAAATVPDSVLHEAVARDRTDMVQALLDAKADANARAGVYGDTAICCAVRCTAAGSLRMLLDAKGDVDAASEWRRCTPLHCVAVSGGEQSRCLLRLLLRFKADVNKMAEIGSPAQVAASGRNLSALHILLRAKADVTRPSPAVPAVQGLPAVVAAHVASSP